MQLTEIDARFLVTDWYELYIFLMSSIPTFETKRLILRPVVESDAISWQKHFDDYEVIRNLSAHVPWPYPKDGVLSFLKSSILPTQGKDQWVWGLFLKEAPDELVGVVHLWREGRPEHRGFWLSRKHWGKGLMTEAVEPVMDHAFDELNFNVLVFANAAGNIGSRRIKEKTGARLLRVEPAKFVDPKFIEHEVWELRKEDWKLRKRV
jgi:ribosomal-protein-alanine N-acetyltransferase